MPATIGVDIGSSAVRVVEVSKLDSDGFAVVSRVGVAPLKQGAVAGGRIRNPQIVSLALKRALQQAGLYRIAKSRGVVVGLSSPDAAIGRLSLPSAIRPEEREGALRGTSAQVSPTVPLEESYISTQTVSTVVGSDGNSVDVISVAAAMEGEVDTIVGVCKLAGVTLRAVDLSGAATVRALVRCAPEGMEVASIVDIGATKMMIATRQGPHLRSMRTASGGGDDITRSIVSVTGEEAPDAERRKAALRLNNEAMKAAVSMGPGYFDEEEEAPQQDVLQQTAVEEALSRTVEQLVDQVASSIESDGANHGTYTQGISLCGGTALLRGLKERLNQRVGVPVQIGAPWASIERSKRNSEYLTNGEADPRLILTLATAIGLALWKEPS